jgi:small-conductance mechanosensitive channel
VPVLDFGVATSELNQSILEAFRSRGIVIPYPRREVQLLPASVETAREPWRFRPNATGRK